MTGGRQESIRQKRLRALREQSKPKRNGFGYVPPKNNASEKGMTGGPRRRVGWEKKIRIGGEKENRRAGYAGKGTRFRGEGGAKTWGIKRCGDSEGKWLRQRKNEKRGSIPEKRKQGAHDLPQERGKS